MLKSKAAMKCNASVSNLFSDQTLELRRSINIYISYARCINTRKRWFSHFCVIGTDTSAFERCRHNWFRCAPATSNKNYALLRAHASCITRVSLLTRWNSNDDYARPQWELCCFWYAWESRKYDPINYPETLRTITHPKTSSRRGKKRELNVPVGPTTSLFRAEEGNRREFLDLHPEPRWSEGIQNFSI